MILEDLVVNQTIGGKIADALNEDFTYELEIFNRECCDEEIERICKCTQACGAKMIVGIGGGKTPDTAKAVGATLNLPIIVIPDSGVYRCAMQLAGCHLHGPGSV
ncbi:iron-containing alcohol dehydrogenase [Escherichia coli]